MTKFSEIRQYIYDICYGGNKKDYKFANTITLNGFLVSKPNVYELGTGQEYIVFTLMQIQPNFNAQYFTCVSNSHKVKEQLLNVKYLSFVNVLAKARRNKNKGLHAQVEMIEISYDFPAFEILPALDFNAYKERKGFGKKKDQETIEELDDEN